MTPEFLNISWQVATILRVLVAFVLAQSLIKLISQKGRRTERFLWQFAVSFAIALCAALVWGARLDWMFLAIFALGFFNTYGTFFQWKAVAISQSRTALFTFWDDIIAMSLSWFFLNEQQFFSPTIGIGIVLSFFALMLFIRHAWKKRNSIQPESFIVPFRFYFYVLSFSVIWGIAYFAERLWAYEGLSIFSFTLGWYGGALISALILFSFYKDRSEATTQAPVGIQGIALSALLGVVIFASMVLSLISYRAPQLVVQPILFVSEMIFPALIGLYFFHERRQFDAIEWLYFALGIMGALIVGLSFSI